MKLYSRTMIATQIRTVGIPPDIASFHANSMITASRRTVLQSVHPKESASYPFLTRALRLRKFRNATITHAITPTMMQGMFMTPSFVENTLPANRSRKLGGNGARDPVELLELRIWVPSPRNARYPASVAIHGGTST